MRNSKTDLKYLQLLEKTLDNLEQSLEEKVNDKQSLLWDVWLNICSAQDKVRTLIEENHRESSTSQPK